MQIVKGVTKETVILFVTKFILTLLVKYDNIYNGNESHEGFKNP